MFIQAPCLTAVVVDSSTSHISLVFEGKFTTYCPMHCASVVPDDEVSRTFPFNHKAILVLRSMSKELVEEFIGRLRFKALNMMNMRGDIQCHATRPLMFLRYPMTTHRVMQGLEVCEVVRSSQLPGVQNRMTADVVIVEELLLGVLVKVVPCRSGVAELSAATSTRGRQLMGQEERKTSATRIETRVDVE